MRNDHGAAETSYAKGKRLTRRHWCVLFLIALLPAVSFLNGCAGVVKGASQTITALFQLNPASVNFGNVTVGKASTQSVTVANTGTVSVNITQATFSNSQFSLSGVTLPMALAAGQSGNFTVALNATAAGNITGTMTVTGDGGSSPAVVNLSATAVAASQPQISVSPASIAFGSVTNGLTGTANLTVSNTGSGNLTVSVIALTGSEFTVSGIATPKAIPAGQNAQAVVTFAPTATGAATGSISITSNDPNNPTVTVSLTGTGSAVPTGQLSASSSTLSFGTVATGSNAKQQFTVTNNGNASVDISAVTVTGTGFSATGLTPGTLNPAETATVTATFAPTAAGNVTGSITITSNAANSPLTIPLSGTGAQAGLSVSPASYTFGSVIDGQTQSESFTITNSGSAALTISQLSVTGTSYSVSGLTLPATIAAGGTTTFSVLFAPTTAGSFPGTVTITSNAANSPATVSLSGTGTAATVTLSASTNSLSFTGIYVGNSSAQNVTITNNGNTSATISQVTVSAKDFTTTGITTPLTLAAGQSATLTVTFTPSASETVTGNITVTSSQGSSAVVSVTGNGVQPALTITPSSASFGDVTVGSPASSQTIQLTNSGTGTLSLTQANVTGSGFSTSSLTLPLSLTAGQSTTFNVQFSPTAAGAVTGNVNLVSNAVGSPASIPLSGTGVAQTLILSFSSTSLAFGTVTTGNSSTLSETIKNTGNSNVQITGITESGTGFSLSGVSTPVTLSPNQTTSFSVVFDPTSSGSASGTVTVTSNATGSPSTISLSGTGQAPATYTVALSWTASTSTVSGYNVYRSTTNGSGYAKINPALVAAVNYTDSTVQDGVTYYYVTTAVDSSGTESSYSNQASAPIP